MTSMVVISETNSFALLAIFGIGPHMAWLFLILAVIMLGPYNFGPYFLALMALALIIWPFGVLPEN